MWKADPYRFCSTQILSPVADNWFYYHIDEQTAWKPMYDYTEGWICFTPVATPSNPFYYIAHEKKHHTDFFDVIWQGTGYNAEEDSDEDGIRDAFEIEIYGHLDHDFDFIMQEDWSEPRADTAGNAASADESNWNKYWSDPSANKHYQP